MPTTIRTEILLLDVIGFSSSSSKIQYKIVRLITEKVKKAFAVLKSPAHLSGTAVAYGFIPTGDGFFVVLNPVMRGYGTEGGVWLALLPFTSGGNVARLRDA